MLGTPHQLTGALARSRVAPKSAGPFLCQVRWLCGAAARWHRQQQSVQRGCHHRFRRACALIEAPPLKLLPHRLHHAAHRSLQPPRPDSACRSCRRHTSRRAASCTNSHVRSSKLKTSSQQSRPSYTGLGCACARRFAWCLSVGSKSSRRRSPVLRSSNAEKCLNLSCTYLDRP